MRRAFKEKKIRVRRAFCLSTGFTLIELLVVIAIIGLLASITLVALNEARENARNSRRISDMKQVQLALALRFDKDSSYPASLNFDSGDPITSEDGSMVYLEQIPTNPEPRDDGVCGDSNYTYSTANANTTYEIEYCISEATGGITAGTHTATPLNLAND
jgi:prepilin-type N-terminal cleavage/methylation domain-containing protein